MTNLTRPTNLDEAWLQSLTSEHVKTLTPYESARRLFSASEGKQTTWLNANESPESERFEIDSELFNRYPDCQPQKLLDVYAKYSGLTASQVLITRGADEGIELLIRAFCESAKDAILICPPTYGMYAISAKTFNVNVKSVPLQNDFSLDLEGIKQYVDKVKLVFLCSPNNPTGTQIPKRDIETILTCYNKKAIIVVDEAYIEFSSESAKQSMLAQYPHLVILRTLSKGFALAGIRCGFVLSSPAIKQVLLKVIAPYPVPDPVAQIASQALNENGIQRMTERVSQLNSELTELSHKLSTVGDIELVGQQCGNFVLFRSAHNKALMTYLVENKFLIRDQSKQLLLDNCLRISIGTNAQNQQLFTLIDQFFSTQSPTQKAVL